MLTAVIVIVGLVVIIMSIVLLSGKDLFLIQKTNARLEDGKPKYDTIAFSRFIGKIFLIMGILTLFLPIAEKSNITWYPTASLLVLGGLVTFSSIYANTGNRFRK